MITQARLKEVLLYSKESGLFYWFSQNGPRAVIGDVAGWVHHSGYIYIQIDNQSYAAHRLAFLYTDGYLPEGQIDHINRKRRDNRRVNLREASRQCNARNSRVPCSNSSGIKGIYFHKINKKWIASVSLSKVERYLGSFESKLEAAYTRYAAEQCLGYPDCDTSSSSKEYIDQHKEDL